LALDAESRLIVACFVGRRDKTVPWGYGNHCLLYTANVRSAIRFLASLHGYFTLQTPSSLAGDWQNAYIERLTTPFAKL